ncbi:hypothetical protein [Lusitaniella coriacea]|uniref:hypothetical protein n=1 Tax=Lusitaniella coriacea TaxID=1983105 RepID=UPI003CE875DD
MPEKPEAPVTDLMELMLDENWVREAACLEDEADCDIEAGLNWGANLGVLVANPAAWSHFVRLRALVLRGFRALLVEWNLGAGIEAAYACGSALLLERLQQPAPALQARLVAALEEAEVSELEDAPSLPPQLRSAVRDLFAPEDWDAIAAAAARGVRERVIAALAAG